MSTAGGLSRFNSRTKTFSNYYEADGLAGTAFDSFPAAHRSQRGQMFFGSKSGLTSFWPEQIADRPSIPPVVLTAFSLQNQPVAPGLGSLLAKSITLTPSLTLSHDQNHTFSFEFAALSYVDPQRNQYRYMLEPLDHSWNRVDPNQRIATFTTLRAGKYMLRVQGSNNRGVWNEQGVTLALEVLPPWWGTTWFRMACAGIFLALLMAGYQMRVRQLHHQFDMMLEARVGERTRIARELHDTLLQSFHGLLLRFQTTLYLLPDRPAEAKAQLVGAIDQAAKAITEGRDAVQGLRSSTLEKNNLALAISALGAELAADGSGPRPAFHVAVEGETRELHPILRDEIYKIAAEALRNAFRHAHAGRVEVEIRYDHEEFRLRVRDDGKGIDPAVLANQGLEGHYGLRGMPERAALIGGKLAVWSESGAGTEVELRLPARIVYATIREALLAVTALGLQDGGARRRRHIMSGASTPIRSHAPFGVGLRQLQGYGLAVLSIGVAVGTLLLFEQFGWRPPSGMLLLTVVGMNTWYGERGPGLFSIILGSLCMDYFLLEPHYTLHVASSDIAYVLSFFALAALISSFSTVRRRVEEDLRNTRDRLRIEVEERSSLLDLTHDSIFVCDMDFVITYWNRGAEEFYGWPQKDAIGKRSDELLHSRCFRSRSTRSGRSC